MGYRLGIDLGTTFTAAATADAKGPVMVGLGNRALQVPSVLFLADDGTFLCAEAAERRAAEQPDRAVREFKRRLGDTVPMLVAGQPFSPQALTAKLLSWVVATVTEREGATPDEVVLTHPANWGGFKRELFSQVAALADLSDVVTCSEPEAAAIQYASHTRVAEHGRLVVYDLGGGTFDVCVLERHRDGFSILGTPDGVEHLGGIDFDEAVFHHVLAALGEQVTSLDPQDPAVTAGLVRLRRDCVEAKEALSNDVDAVVPVSLAGVSTSVRLTRSELEGLIGPAVRETLAATQRALRSASTAAEDLAAVVLVGGSSRIPLISQLLQSELGVATAMDTHPKHDIALGAVRYRSEHAPPAPEAAAATTATAAAAAPPRAAAAVAAWPTRGAGGEAESSPTPAPAVDAGVPDPTPPPPSPSPTTVAAPEGPPAARPGASTPVITPWWRRRIVGVVVLTVAVVVIGALLLNRDGDGDTGVVSPPEPTETATGSIPESAVVVAADRDGVVDLLVADGDSVEPLIPGGPPEVSRTVPAISPDRRFVFFREGSPTGFKTRVFDVESEDVVDMVAPSEDLTCVGRPAWDPTTADQEAVALICGSDPRAAYRGSMGEDGQISALTELGLGSGLVNLSYTDEGAVVTTRGRNSTLEAGVHVQVADSDVRLVSGTGAAAAAASPADGRIAFEQAGSIRTVMTDRSTPPCEGGVLQTDPQTAVQVCLLTDGSDGVDSRPAWSPDGQRLVFTRGDERDAATLELLEIDPAGGEPQPFSSTLEDVNGSVAWAAR